MMLASQHSTAQRLIHILLRQLGPGAELIEAQEREWASATFNGARHILHFRLPLLAAAAAPPDALYDEGKGNEGGRFEFDRTISRLMEMQSDDYLALGHGED